MRVGQERLIFTDLLSGGAGVRNQKPRAGAEIDLYGAVRDGAGGRNRNMKKEERFYLYGGCQMAPETETKPEGAETKHVDIFIDPNCHSIYSSASEQPLHTLLEG